MQKNTTRSDGRWPAISDAPGRGIVPRRGCRHDHVDRGRRDAIEPGQFEQFWVSAGPMPSDVESLEFAALQTYDSDVVRWIEPTPRAVEKNPSILRESHSSPSDVAAAPAAAGDGTTKAVIALIVGDLGLIAGISGLVAARKRTV